MRIGGNYKGRGKCDFCVWAPYQQSVSLAIHTPHRRIVAMEKHGAGYWQASLDDILPGALYSFILNGSVERADPASHSLPYGIDGKSEIIDHASFPWEDAAFTAVSLSDSIIYEIHIGTFTREGTFEAAARRVVDLRDIGITTVELMPVAQFPGARNWGYDGVLPFAVHDSYGGPAGLKHFVNECHKNGLSVVLDVVYNHLGPEGNYLNKFGPYFTDKYKTPWGEAVNFDGPCNDEVRNFFIENALHWFEHYHMDGLRVDAVHAIIDMSAYPFLSALTEAAAEYARARKRNVFLIAESDLNDSKIVAAKECGGYNFDAQWCDDFHHALHAILTGERQGYYGDFGTLEQLASSLREGFVYKGQYSDYRKKRFGNSSQAIPARKFIVFSQNHDQAGNRREGERLSALVSFEKLKVACGAVLLSPYVPLLFMGEEYGEDAPFLYFVSHTDPALAEAVRRGRKEEFGTFNWADSVPDPAAVETYARSKLSWEKRDRDKNRELLDLYRTLIRLRKETPALKNPDKTSLDVTVNETTKTMTLRRWHGESRVAALFNFGDEPQNIPPPGDGWEKLLDSSDRKWAGPGMAESTGGARDDVRLQPSSFALFALEKETQ